MDHSGSCPWARVVISIWVTEYSFTTVVVRQCGMEFAVLFGICVWSKTKYGYKVKYMNAFPWTYSITLHRVYFLKPKRRSLHLLRTSSDIKIGEENGAFWCKYGTGFTGLGEIHSRTISPKRSCNHCFVIDRILVLEFGMGLKLFSPHYQYTSRRTLKYSCTEKNNYFKRKKETTLKGLGHAILGNFRPDQIVIELTKI